MPYSTVHVTLLLTFSPSPSSKLDFRSTANLHSTSKCPRIFMYPLRGRRVHPFLLRLTFLLPGLWCQPLLQENPQQCISDQLDRSWQTFYITKQLPGSINFTPNFLGSDPVTTSFFLAASTQAILSAHLNRGNLHPPNCSLCLWFLPSQFIKSNAPASSSKTQLWLSLFFLKSSNGLITY